MFGPRGVVIHELSPVGQADRRHRPAYEKAHGDGGRGSHQQALDFMDKAQRAASRSSCGGTRTACTFSRTSSPSVGKTGLGVYADGMVEHDGEVGQLLDKLKELGIEDNTIVMYSTDNGAETMSWPDGGTTFPRREKYELGRRLSRARFIRWPGVIKPGTIVNDIGSHEDMMPTLAAAGDPDVHGRSAEGGRWATNLKVHLDGYNLMPLFKGKAVGRARNLSTGPTTATSPPCATTTGK